MNHIYMGRPNKDPNSNIKMWFLTTKANGTSIYYWYPTKPTKPQIRRFKKWCKKEFADLYESERILSMPDEQFKKEFS